MTASLDWVDSLPPEVRALVHEFGERAVRACWDLRITEARQIRTLIEAARAEPSQVRHVATEAEVVGAVRRKVKALGSQAAFARRSGLFPVQVCKVLQGKYPVTEAVANAAGYARKVIYLQVRA